IRLFRKVRSGHPAPAGLAVQQPAQHIGTRPPAWLCAGRLRPHAVVYALEHLTRNQRRPLRADLLAFAPGASLTDIARVGQHPGDDVCRPSRVAFVAVADVRGDAFGLQSLSDVARGRRALSVGAEDAL